MVGVTLVVVISAVLARRFTPASVRGDLWNPEGFARLLVAEIGMYRGKTVDRAWSESAIYRVLKDDIDRSRQMFLKRFPASEPSFYVALVSILGRGEEGRIGVEYPYSRTSPSVSSVTQSS